MNIAVLRVALVVGVVVAQLVGGVARADDPPPPVTVVVNEKTELKALNKEELRNVYLGKTTFWPNNTKVTAYDRPVDKPAGQAFYRDVLKMVPARFRHHWQSKQLSGQGSAPEAVAGADDVVARVAVTAGGVAYLHKDEVPKVLPKGVVVLVVPVE